MCIKWQRRDKGRNQKREKERKRIKETERRKLVKENGERGKKVSET